MTKCKVCGYEMDDKEFNKKFSESSGEHVVCPKCLVCIATQCKLEYNNINDNN